MLTYKLRPAGSEKRYRRRRRRRVCSGAVGPKYPALASRQ